MNNFGTIKSKILETMIESYVNNDKKTIKKLLKEISKNKSFRDLYVFYEHIENKYIENKEDAKTFVNHIIPLLQEHYSKVIPEIKLINKLIGNKSIEKNIVYENLDILSEPDNLENVDKKIIAKLSIIEHLIKPKEIINDQDIPIIKNETLLQTVLSNNFNAFYDNILNEDQKSELRQILSLSNEDIENNFTILKEEMVSKLNKLLEEENDLSVKNKINDVLKELTTMNISKFNYYKLTQLKNGI
jgi:hypothetical protein